MAAVWQTTLANAFAWKKTLRFRLKFHWSLFPWLELTIPQHWCRKWLGAEQATSHYLNQLWFILLTHICVTRLQWVKNKFSFFRCDQAALRTFQSAARPSVSLSVRPSVTPFSQCSSHHIITKFSEVITIDKGDVHAKGQCQRSKD